MARLTTDQRRAQLLQVGREVFAERSYDSVSVQDLAQAAGVSKGLIYHYFADKAGYYREVLCQAAEQVLRISEPQDAPTLQQSLGQALDRFLAYVQDNPNFYRALVRGGVGTDPTTEAVVERLRRQTVARVVKRAELQPTPSQSTLLYGWVGLVECATLDWLSRQHLSAQELRTLLLTALFTLLEIS